MLKKTIFVAVAMSILASGFQVSTASANGSVNVRDHRTRVEIRDHRTERPNEVVIVHKAPCYSGALKLRGLGYNHVSVTDCKTARYSYRAFKGNGIYAATMNAYSRSLKIKLVGFAH